MYLFIWKCLNFSNSDVEYLPGIEFLVDNFYSFRPSHISPITSSLHGFCWGEKNPVNLFKDPLCKVSPSLAGLSFLWGFLLLSLKCLHSLLHIVSEISVPVACGQLVFWQTLSLTTGVKRKQKMKEKERKRKWEKCSLSICKLALSWGRSLNA